MTYYVNYEGYDINYRMSFDDFAEGIAAMSDAMSAGSSQTTTCIYPPQVKQYSGVGSGVGTTYVCFDVNIVQCNKHDKDLKSINAAQFAFGNSDCAASVKLGIVALSPLSSNDTRAYYINSTYCVNESLNADSSKDNGNIYCDGTKKAGNHVNCSWFNGIGHSERFHYHKYS